MSLQECKDKIAQNHGYDDWRSKIYENGDYMMEMLWEEVIKLYTSQLQDILKEIIVYPETEDFHERYMLTPKGKELYKALTPDN